MNTPSYYHPYLPSTTYPTQQQQQQPPPPPKPIIQAQTSTSIYHPPTTSQPPPLQTEPFYYSTLDFVNQDEEVMEIIAEMLDKASNSNYYILPNEPPNIEKLMTIQDLREVNKKNIIDKLTKFKQQYEKSGYSTFEEKIKTNNQKNMKYYRINNDYLTSLTVKLLEVKCFIVSGGTGSYSLVPNKIGNIEFGDDIQKIIEEYLIQPIAEELKISKPSQGKIWSASMYIDGHKDKQCSLKCKEIISQKHSQFQNECLRQRINLGVQFCPFVANPKGDEVYMGSPLGNVYIKNAKVYGIGRNRIPYASETFVENKDSPCPVNALISFGLSEIGIFNNKILLYLRNLDSVFYSDIPANNIRNSASDSIKQILLTNSSIRKKLTPKYTEIIYKVIDEVATEEAMYSRPGEGDGNGNVTVEENNNNSPPFKRIKIGKKVKEEVIERAEECDLEAKNREIIGLNEENCNNYESREEDAINFLDFM